MGRGGGSVAVWWRWSALSLRAPGDTGSDGRERRNWVDIHAPPPSLSNAVKSSSIRGIDGLHLLLRFYVFYIGERDLQLLFNAQL